MGTEHVAFIAAGARLMMAHGLRFERGPDGSLFLSVADTADRSWWGVWVMLER